MKKGRWTWKPEKLTPASTTEIDYDGGVRVREEKDERLEQRKTEKDEEKEDEIDEELGSGKRKAGVGKGGGK